MCAEGTRHLSCSWHDILEGWKYFAFSGGSVTLGSCTVIMWFISLLTVLAHNNDLVHQIWQVTQIGLIIWVDRFLMMGYWHDMVLWLVVNTYTSMCWSSKLNDRPEKSHFTFPSFAPATRLCPPKAYIGMITRKLKSLLQMTLNALKICTIGWKLAAWFTFWSVSLIHGLFCVS